MIKDSFKKTLSIIKKNKLKVLFIFFLQVLFFIALGFILYNTINPAMENAKKAIDYYSNVSINESSGAFSLGKDPLTFYGHYNKIFYYLRIMALSILLTFIIVNGLIWALNDNLVNKKNLKEFFNYLFNFTAISVLSILIFLVLALITLKPSLDKLNQNSIDLMPSFIILLLTIVLIDYFLYISLGMISKKKLKDILRLTLKIGIFKFPSVILAYLINLVIIALPAYLISVTIELNIFILSITLMLFVFSFVFTKLFLIIAINNLAKEI